MIFIPRIAILWVVSAGLAAPAQAFFDFADKSQAPTPAAVDTVGLFTQIGSGTASKIAGYGKDVPLGLAVEMLASGWTLVDANGNAAGIKVSWDPNGTWHLARPAARHIEQAPTAHARELVG